MADGDQMTAQAYAGSSGGEKAADSQKDRRKKIRRGDRQTRFLAQSVILEEGGSSRLIRLAMVAICISII